jgi:hypothetical protein
MANLGRGAPGWAGSSVTMRRTLCAGFAAPLMFGQMSFAQTQIDITAYFQKTRDLRRIGFRVPSDDNNPP